MKFLLEKGGIKTGDKEFVIAAHKLLFLQQYNTTKYYKEDSVCSIVVPTTCTGYGGVILDRVPSVHTCTQQQTLPSIVACK